MTPSTYHDAILQVTNFLQVIIYKRETCPIKDRMEVHEDITKRVTELIKHAANGKAKWRRGLLELAAYAVFAAVSDQ